MTYDITRDYNRPFPGEQPFFTDTLANLQDEDSTIGINGINWYASLYPNLYQHKDRLVLRFNQKYAFREIGSETVSRWMFQLQNRYDEIADKFNHAYKLYNNDEINIDNLTLGYTRSIDSESSTEGSSSGSSSGSSNSKFKDTPTSETSTINNPTTEDVGTTSSESAGETSSSGEVSTTENYEYHDEHVIDEVNKIINHYKQLDEEFINSFNEMFMGIITVL